MVAGQSLAAQNIHQALLEHENIGEMFFRLPFVLLKQDGSIQDARLTEICWTRKERLAAYKAEMPDWRDKPLMIAPDLAVNVLPYNGSVTDTHIKFERDLRLGVQMVWIVDPRLKSVTVRHKETHAKLVGDNPLKGGEIIPGFEMPVKVIFG